jgi:hypothetical protein
MFLRPWDMVRSWGAYEAWIGIWYLGYVVLRILLRVLIGRRRRNFVQKKLRLHYMRARDVLSYLICGVCVWTNRLSSVWSRMP